MSDTSKQPLRVVEPSTQWRDAFLDMAQEVAEEGDDRYRAALNDFDLYLLQLAFFRLGENLPEGRVRESTYWLVDDQTVIGCCRLRHDLTPSLYQVGGNIGYDIRPNRRGQGYGTVMLALVLEQARQAGLEKVLITCNTDNIASSRVIEKNGGQLWDRGKFMDEGAPISRYWIEL